MLFIGDVHGCLRTLKALLAKCPKDEKLVFVGDLIDRGPDSAEVVEFVKSGGHDCVMGNHELLMLDACSDKADPDLDDFDMWRANGGLATAQSYTRHAPELRGEHLRWMRSLPKYIPYPRVEKVRGRYPLVSHAGLYYTVGEKLETAIKKACDTNDIMWHRDEIWDYPEVYQIVGHTPVPCGAVVKAHYADIDTGCYIRRPKYSQGRHTAFYGKMTALHWPSMQVYEQDNIEEG